MNKVTNKTRLAENWYSNHLKKFKKEIRKNTKKQKKQNIKIRKSEEDYKKFNHRLQKTKKTTRLQKKNQYESIKRKVSLRKQTESNKEKK